jgi:hypothetical protein
MAKLSCVYFCRQRLTVAALFIFALFFPHKGYASRIVPLEKGKTGFEESVFVVGVSKDTLENRTKKRFLTTAPGVSLGWYQCVRRSWFGGLRIHTAEWEVSKKNPETTEEDVTFLQAESVVNFSPKLNFFNENSFSYRLNQSLFNPYFSLGLGAIFFLKNRGFPAERSKIETAEPSVSYAIGNKIVFGNLVAIGIGAEKFRGIKTFNYTGLRWALSLHIGDVLATAK